MSVVLGSIGQMVEWESKAGGVNKKKAGAILAKVAPGVDPKVIMATTDLQATHRIMFDGGKTRNEVGYLVSVPGRNKGNKAKLYFPMTSKLSVAGVEPVSEAQPIPPAPQTQNPVQQGIQFPPKRLLVNNVVLCIDLSSSMASHESRLPKLLSSQIEAQDQAFAAEGQSGLYSVVTFSDPENVKVLFSGKDISSVREELKRTRLLTNGWTALRDGLVMAMKTATDIENKTKNLYDVANLVNGLTDGEENSSSIQEGPFIELMKAFCAENGTVTLLVPDGTNLEQTSRLTGIPVGNMKCWDTTSEKGLEEASKATADSSKTYAESRTQGKRKVERFYLDMSKINYKDIQKKLVDVSANMRVCKVKKTGQRIGEFYKEKMHEDFRSGACYYELHREERLNKDKAVIFQKKGEDEMYRGPAWIWMQLAGIDPAADEFKLDPHNLQDFRIYVQNQNPNRKLTAGTTILIDKSYVGGMRPTFNPVTQVAMSKN